MTVYERERALVDHPQGEKYLHIYLSAAMGKPSYLDCWQAELMRHTATQNERWRALRAFYKDHGKPQ